MINPTLLLQPTPHTKRTVVIGHPVMTLMLDCVEIIMLLEQPFVWPPQHSPNMFNGPASAYHACAFWVQLEREKKREAVFFI